jgi:F-type H+-transporting ATPase subunit delta
VQEIASVYARALFQAAQEEGRLDGVREQLGQFAQALADNEDLRLFFFSPYFSSTEKRDGLGRLLTGADPLISNFLELLVESHRMPVMPALCASFEELWERENRLIPVQVTSAIELSQDTISDIGKRIGQQTGQKVALTSTVDPDILGGIVLRVGNSILDASIRGRLEQLRKEVVAAA